MTSNKIGVYVSEPEVAKVEESTTPISEAEPNTTPEEEELIRYGTEDTNGDGVAVISLISS